jgi:hypothetical protein
MPRQNDIPNDLPDIRVVLRNAQGKYVAWDANGVYLTLDRHEALVLSYRADRVAEQIEEIWKSQGISLAAEPVPLEEIYETCDQCHDQFMPFMTFFDGKRFLCNDCRRKQASGRSRRA